MAHLSTSRPAADEVRPPAPDARRPALSLSIYPTAAEERLIRQLALDRLRDLHDDGVTVDYMGRMYGVGGEQIRRVERRLRSLR